MQRFLLLNMKILVKIFARIKKYKKVLFFQTFATSKVYSVSGEVSS